MTIYNPKQIKRDLVKVKTVKQALAIKTPTVGFLVKTYGERQIEAYIKIWLVELNELINTARFLSEAQIDETAFLIISEYRALSVADINIIFRKAKLGEYGALYESLSMDKVLTWFRDYFNDRCSTAGQMTREAHDKIKYQGERTYTERTSETTIKKQFVKDANFKQFKKEYYKKD